MTPEGRLSAAIELFEHIQTNAFEKALSADVVVKNFFRARRYAGSKDRRAISDLVYDVLRTREELIWRLSHAAMEATPRSQIICYLALKDQLDTSLFAGNGYAPDPLTAEEAAFLKNLQLDNKPAHDRVRGNCPQWLESRLRQRFGEDFEAELLSLNDRAALDVRIQPMRIDRAKLVARLINLGIACEASPYSPLGIRIDEHVALSGVDAYAHGLIDVQDEGAQIASLLVDAKPKMQVLDLCAGAGGKSLTLAGLMENTGQIIAMDVDQHRLSALDDRSNRSRYRNIQKKLLPKDHNGRDAILSPYHGKMDRVILDVPCSGTGTWRRSPELRIRLDEPTLAELVNVQAALLDEAAPLVKQGGRMVYITCSLLQDENEDQVMAFLQRHENWTLVPWRNVWPNINSDVPLKSVSAMDDMLQLTPHKHGTDGFFVAILECKVK